VNGLLPHQPQARQAVAVREAIHLSIAERGASVADLVVYLSDETGRVGELSDRDLASWAGIDKPHEFALPA